MGSHAKYPYLFETYETEQDSSALSAGNGAEVSIAKGGANGSGGSLRVLHSKAGFVDLSYSCALKPVKGQKISLSVWVKLNSELKETYNDKRCNAVSFIFYGNRGTVTNKGSQADLEVGQEFTGTGWKQYDVTDGLVKGQWVKISKEISWEDMMSIGSGAVISDVSVGSLALRITGEAGTNALANAEDKVVDYQIDDFCMEFLEEDRLNPTVNTTAGTYLVNKDYDNSDDAVTEELNGRSEDCSAKYKKITIPDSSSGFGEQDFSNLPLQVGHLYKISGWFRYDKNPDSTVDHTGRAKLRQIVFASERDKNDPNSFPNEGNFPSIYPAVIEESTWTKVEYYYYWDYKSYDNRKYQLGFRICAEETAGGVNAYKQDNSSAGIYGFDKIQVLDLGLVGNGDMELHDVSLPVYRNTNEVTQTFPGWSASGATLAASNDTMSGEGTSMKITATSDYGVAQTPVTLEQGKLYRIRFKAKTEGLEEGADELPLTIVFDRKVDDNKPRTTEIYEVPNYQFMNGLDNFEQNKYEWTVSNNWKEYTGWYFVNFNRITGKEEADAANAVPRRAELYFRVNGTSPKDSVLYLDDVKIEEMADNTVWERMKGGLHAKVTDISAQGAAIPGNEISLSYTYQAQYGETENKNSTLIKAYTQSSDGNIRNYGCFGPNDTFTVPNCAAGQEITFEIIPISTEGIIGNRNKITVDAATNYIHYDAEAGNVLAAYNGDTAKIIFASYNGNQMTSAVDVDATFVNGIYEAAVPSEFKPAEGDTVKVMLWKDLTNCVPVCAYAE